MPAKTRSLGLTSIGVSALETFCCQGPHVSVDIKSTVSPFLFLAVDLPPPPLFQDAVKKNIIPQVSIYSVLAKYDGKTTQVNLALILYYITLFIVKYRSQPANYDGLNVSVSRNTLFYTSNGLPRISLWKKKTLPSSIFLSEDSISGNVRSLFPLSVVPILTSCPSLFKSDIDAPPSHESTLYDLIANVTHESVAGTARDKEHTVWKVHLRAAGGGGEAEKWFLVHDLFVEEARKEMIFLGETVLQVNIFRNLIVMLLIFY